MKTWQNKAASQKQTPSRCYNKIVSKPLYWVLGITVVVIFNVTIGLLALKFSQPSSRNQSSASLTGNVKIRYPRSPRPALGGLGYQSGIYYSSPGTLTPQGELRLLGRSVPAIPIPPGGFDLRTDALVTTNNDELIIRAASGTSEQIRIPGLYHMARPSFSPDGLKVVVQASETYSSDEPPQDINIYTVDLALRTFERISFSEENEESPEWFPTDNRITYVLFSRKGLSINIYDIDSKRIVQTIADAGSSHLAVSPDGNYIFEPTRGRIYDTHTGHLVSDSKDRIVSSLQSSGFKLDTRFPGQANAGTFPLDGDFSPDGKTLIFDGAVVKNGKYGMVLAQINSDGTNFKLLTGLLQVNPAYANNNNYSQINPLSLK